MAIKRIELKNKFMEWAEAPPGERKLQKKLAWKERTDIKESNF